MDSTSLTMCSSSRATHERDSGERGGSRDCRQASGKRVLFLDFDGVLHPTVSDGGRTSETWLVTTGLFGWLPHLAQLLMPHPDVVVVVHSTWRYTHDIDELRAILGPLGPRVAGVTPRGPRYESVLWWLHLNPQFDSHRILDDSAIEFPTPLPSELILCDPSMGVSSDAVARALRAWLNARP